MASGHAIPGRVVEPRGFRAADRAVDGESVYLDPHDSSRRAQMCGRDGKEADTAGPRGSDRKGSHAHTQSV